MDELLLVEEDGCFTIIFKESVIINPNIKEINIGSTIKYLWPENAVCRKEYSGEVIAISGEST